MAYLERALKELEECLGNEHNGYCTVRGTLIWGVRELLLKPMLKEKQPKWIPVSERKPKSMANKVIVYLEHEDLTPMIGYGHFERYQGEEMWYDLETCEQFSKHGYTVTYWMPMPKSPDGKTLILC